MARLGCMVGASTTACAVDSDPGTGSPPPPHLLVRSSDTGGESFDPPSPNPRYSRPPQARLRPASGPPQARLRPASGPPPQLPRHVCEIGWKRAEGCPPDRVGNIGLDVRRFIPHETNLDFDGVLGHRPLVFTLDCWLAFE